MITFLNQETCGEGLSVTQPEDRWLPFSTRRLVVRGCPWPGTPGGHHPSPWLWGGWPRAGSRLWPVLKWKRVFFEIWKLVHFLRANKKVKIEKNTFFINKCLRLSLKIRFEIFIKKICLKQMLTKYIEGVSHRNEIGWTGIGRNLKRIQ